jgi:hypothetical protein
MPARKRKPAKQSTEATVPTVLEAQAPSEPDVFDQVIAGQAVSQMAAEENRATEPQATSSGPATPVAAFQPDPFSVISVALTDSNDGPRVRLFRNRRFNQMAIQFDEKPPEEVRQRLRDEQYKWRDAEGVWTIQLGEQKASGQIAAERLVVELANSIRAEAWLPPVGRAMAG